MISRGPCRFRPRYFLLTAWKVRAVPESLIGGLQKRASIAAIGILEEETETVLFTETYTFDDGHSDTLHWTIRKIGPSRYTGHENRLEGEAKGKQTAQ
jgi:uncharacterized protein DUF3833